MGQLTNIAIENSINTNCSESLQGVDNHAKIDSEDIRTCEDASVNDISVTVKNYGNNPITSLDYEVVSGSNVSQESQNINLQKFDEQTFELSSFLDSNFNNYVEITSVNSTSNYSPNLSVKDINVEGANVTDENDIEIRVYTDNYPSEISWSLKDEVLVLRLLLAVHINLAQLTNLAVADLTLILQKHIILPYQIMNSVTA